MPHRDIYELKIVNVEWDDFTPFIVVIWKITVKHAYTDKVDKREMIFPLCLS